MTEPFTSSGQQPQLTIFRRRYLQMEDPDEIEFPSRELVKSPTVQAWLFQNMFDEDRHPFLPHARYRYRVLKKLITILEEAMDDPEEDVRMFILRSTMSKVCFLIFSPCDNTDRRLRFR